jgi:hypothetical protein
VLLLSGFAREFEAAAARRSRAGSAGAAAALAAAAAADANADADADADGAAAGGAAAGTGAHAPLLQDDLTLIRDACAHLAAAPYNVRCFARAFSARARAFPHLRIPPPRALTFVCFAQRLLESDLKKAIGCAGPLGHRAWYDKKQRRHLCHHRLLTLRARARPSLPLCTPLHPFILGAACAISSPSWAWLPLRLPRLTGAPCRLPA